MARNAIEPTSITAETYLTSHEAGKLIQSNPSSINKWVKEGLITAHATPGGHRRIKAADFVAFLSAHNMPVPSVLAFAFAPVPMLAGYTAIKNGVRFDPTGGAFTITLPVAKTKKPIAKKSTKRR